MALSVDEGAPLILPSDVIFLGLMFNAASIANVVSEKFAPKVYVLVIAATSVLSVSLIGAYSLSLHENALQCFLWGWILLTLFLSVLLSFYASDSGAIFEVQRVLDRSSQISALPPYIRDKAHAVLEVITSDEALDAFETVFSRYDWRLANKGSALVVGQDEQGKPVLKLNEEPSPDEELYQLLDILLERFDGKGQLR